MSMSAKENTHITAVEPMFDAMRQYRYVRLELIPLGNWQSKDSKGRSLAKIPADSKWTTRTYRYKDVLERAVKGGLNLGVRIPADVVVLDVDPRNFVDGQNSLTMLVQNTGLDLKFSPHVVTGSGGDHYYFSKPADIELVNSLEKYPGIEFKSFKRQVVAAGSVHPNGEHYTWAIDSPPLTQMPDMPIEILRLALKQPRLSERTHVPGEITPDQLEKTLESLDPEKFSGNDDWFPLMVACHQATNGEGREEFIHWSTSATGFSEHGANIGARWDSLDANHGAGITVATLHHILNQVGASVAPSDPENDFDEWIEEVVEPSSVTPRWNFLSMEQVEALPPPKWLVPGLLTETSIAAIYGAPESGKSFLAVDIAMSVASGLDWHGREVLSGGVLYIAAEGAPGLGKRVRAWKEAHAANSQKFHFVLMRDPINFASENTAEVRDFTQAVMAEVGALKLVIIDTLNQTAAGADENSAKDMSRYITSMKRLRDETGAAVIVVHHSGKDGSKGMRGSTALLGAMDTTIEVDRVKDLRSITVTVRKQKDAEKEAPSSFNLEPIGGSLVLKPTLMADPEDDFITYDDPVLEKACSMAHEAGGALDLVVLVGALMKEGKQSESTVRRNINKVLKTGRNAAKITRNGFAVWLEGVSNNKHGPVEVRAVSI